MHRVNESKCTVRTCMLMPLQAVVAGANKLQRAAEAHPRPFLARRLTFPCRDGTSEP